MHCKVPCVEECISTTIIRSLLQHVCFPAIQNCLSETPSSATKVTLPFLSHQQYDLSFKTALLVIPLILEAIPSISFLIILFLSPYSTDLIVKWSSHSSPGPGNYVSISFSRNSILSITVHSPERRYGCSLWFTHSDSIDSNLSSFSSNSPNTQTKEFFTTTILESCVQYIASSE